MKKLTLFIAICILSSCGILNDPGCHSIGKNKPEQMYRTYHNQNGKIFKIGE